MGTKSQAGSIDLKASPSAPPHSIGCNATFMRRTTMNYDFELKNRGYLKIEGPLSEPDSIELEKILLMSLEKCHALELNIDNITSISTPCIEILGQAGGMAKQREKALFLNTRYQREAMSKWIRNIAALNQGMKDSRD